MKSILFSLPIWQRTREAQLYLKIRRKAQPKEEGACGVTGLMEVVRGRQDRQHWRCWLSPALLHLGKTPLQVEEATNNQIILIIPPQMQQTKAGFVSYKV